MDETDYIIVGAGSAGSVLAERLTASGRHTVTVIEAGGSDRRFFVQLPLGYGKLFYDPAVNWMYRTEPDPGLAGQQDHWPRGKLLGGSSSINAMVWTRGHKDDYAEWGAENPGWGWDECLAAYRAIEDTQAGGTRGAGRAGRCSSVKTAAGCTGWSTTTSPPAGRRGWVTTLISMARGKRGRGPIS